MGEAAVPCPDEAGDGVHRLTSEGFVVVIETD